MVPMLPRKPTARDSNDGGGGILAAAAAAEEAVVAVGGGGCCGWDFFLICLLREHAIQLELLSAFCCACDFSLGLYEHAAK